MKELEQLFISFYLNILDRLFSLFTVRIFWDLGALSDVTIGNTFALSEYTERQTTVPEQSVSCFKCELESSPLISHLIMTNMLI